MRLLSFVPCGCRAGPIDDAPPVDHRAAAARDAAAATRRRRRRRAAAARSAVGAAPQWRPSLGDICEEYDGTAAAAGPARARKAASWYVARVLPRSHSDEYRHSSMPAFAPTAYLF
ncbi:hypothetical protein U9M48_040942 [Paspalum notatum var. saurae]|uniref:Uncharacterized protein n=1 Tax=Paspalum notatum var. saurae TaxID=547442 RepID=A0AAQ3XER0_PASNO